MSKDLQDSLKKYPSSTKPFNPPLSERFCRLEKLARAPGLQGKEDEGISRRGGSCYLGWWTWAFLFFPEYSTFCFSFHLHEKQVCVYLLFHAWSRKSSLCSLMVQKRSCPLILTFLFCTQGFLHTVVPLSCCLHWEVQVFQVILTSLGSGLQGLSAPEMLCFLEFGYFRQCDLLVHKFYFDLGEAD